MTDWFTRSLIPSFGADSPTSAPVYGVNAQGYMPGGGIMARTARTPGAPSMGYPQMSNWWDSFYNNFVNGIASSAEAGQQPQASQPPPIPQPTPSPTPGSPSSTAIPPYTGPTAPGAQPSDFARPLIRPHPGDRPFYAGWGGSPAAAATPPAPIRAPIPPPASVPAAIPPQATAQVPARPPGTSLSSIPSSLWDPQGAGFAAAQRLAQQRGGPWSAWDPQGVGYAASQRLAQPTTNVTSFMGGPPITAGGVPFPAQPSGPGSYVPTTGNARGATWVDPAPPPAPPSFNLGYGGGRAPAPAPRPAPRYVAPAVHQGWAGFPQVQKGDVAVMRPTWWNPAVGGSTVGLGN